MDLEYPKNAENQDDVRDLVTTNDENDLSIYGFDGGKITTGYSATHLHGIAI